MTLHVIYLLSTLSCIYVGMMSLNLSTDKVFKEIFRQKITSKQIYVLRILGWLFLILAMISSIAAWGMAIGIAAWFGIATFIVGLLIYIYAYQPQWAWYITIALIVLVIGLQIFRLF
ncbi:DUF3325 domain-containing protein [Acinetobacter populi]|uniref:DUF3325 domain-containing protein n=1 Tax=Acinetobacter populi TaxID=1582270 RepID=A0A1Z9YZA3_9GAMM|nr:DUF3325 domain-containing protein [Acinetobacter populi]OUY07543.1 hypothetical protein CAP51_07275 [Acinetobacter populi]